MPKLVLIDYYLWNKIRIHEFILIQENGGELFLTLECQLIFTERMIELGNYNVVTITVIIVLGKEHQ